MEYKLIKSRRKTVCIQVLFDGSVVVRAPYGFTKAMAEDFVKRHEKWIISKQKIMNGDMTGTPAGRTVPKSGSGASARADVFTEAELRKLHDEAKAWFPPEVEKYSKAIGVTYNRIFIKSQKTLWGSCSARGNLNFNCLLMLAPEEVRKYVIVHELCHRRFMDHSRAFWQLVAVHCPGWKTQRAWLRKNGAEFINRLPK